MNNLIDKPIVVRPKGGSEMSPVGWNGSEWVDRKYGPGTVDGMSVDDAIRKHKMSRPWGPFFSGTMLLYTVIVLMADVMWYLAYSMLIVDVVPMFAGVGVYLNPLTVKKIFYASWIVLTQILLLWFPGGFSAIPASLASYFVLVSLP